MKRGWSQVIIILSVLAVLVLSYFILTRGDKHYVWYENYKAGNDQPYGTLFIKSMLESYRPGVNFILNDKEPLRKSLPEVDNPANTDYVLIGGNMFLDEASTKALTSFIEAGGDAFIATLTPPEAILNAVYFRECDADISYASIREPSANMNFFHTSLKTPEGYDYAFRFQTEDVPYTWNYIAEEIFCDSTRSVAPVGHLAENHVNFARIKVGKGNLYLHTNPLVFTNYFLTMPEKVEYASAVFSHLDGKDIIWDEFSKIRFMGDNNAYNSPLYYILQQPSLKYAWWLLLITVLLYVFFAAKRTQRVIPVLEPKTNTSLEFVNLISQLHYKNGNHVDMARKKMKYFLYFVRSKYGIHVEKFREEHIRRLAEKSRVRLADVEVIFSRYYLIEDRFRDNIEVNRMVDLYDAIENFYRQCK